MAEFKIGRLRFTWAGQWAAATFYNRDAVSQYEGKTYVCLEPHTSNADFYHDLYYVTPGGASTPYWTLMMDGKQWVGDWSPTTKFSLGNIVIYGGTIYECTTQHTSTSSFDATKWSLYSQFDRWQSAWAPSTSYGLNDIVKYGGIVYRCTEIHVSASTTALGLEDDLEKWEVAFAGIDYKNDWATATRYKLNDLVKTGVDIYKCTLGHTSTTSFDITKWELWMPGQEYGNTWSSTSVYQPGDIVMYGGYSYISLTINNTDNIPSVSGSDWDIVTQGYQIQNSWGSGTQYKIGDVVNRGGNLYVAIQDNSAQDPTGFATATVKASPSYSWTVANISGTITQGPPATAPGTYYAVMSFTVPTEGEEIVEAWGPTTSLTITTNGATTHTYTLSQPLSGGSGTYTALFSETFTDYGTVTEMEFSNTYDAGTTLTVDSTTGIVQGMIVVGAGYTQGQTVVRVLSATTVQITERANDLVDPGTSLEFVGVNYVYWDLIVPGIAWRNVWANDTAYQVGQLVVWQNATYRCIYNHTSSNFFRPDLDVANSRWIVQTTHAKENAGNTVGDIVTYNNGATTAVHVLPDGGEAGDTNNYLLRINDTQPNWTKMFIIPDTFYVALEGVDDDLHGETIDMPWRTIKHACEQVARGFFFNNANTLIQENKEWIIEEMYLWMLAQVEAENSPFTSTSVFDETATKRDARIIIDSLSHDLVRGSNARIIQSARAYFAEDSDSTFFNQETDDAQLYIVASLERITTLINYILLNQDPDVNYQLLNVTWDSEATYAEDDIVYYNEGYYQSITDSNGTIPTDTENWVLLGYDPEIIIAQYKNQSLTLESGAYLEVTSLMDIVINAVQNATTRELPLVNKGKTASIFVKTGTYSEQLPIVVPANTAIVGDELRGTVVQPFNNIFTTATRTYGATNLITLQNTDELEVGMPIQFLSTNSDWIANRELSRSDIVTGQTYYVKSIDGTEITISETVGGATVDLDSSLTDMAVYAGECLKDMFYMHDATGLRNMTLTGLAGGLSPINEFSTRRPTGGAYTSLDAGTGPDDTSTWIVTRSPYIQNVTTFGVGCTGLKIDGTLHNGGNRSMVCNDYTQILSDGIGVWCTGTKSLTECVSVFGYYNYAAYMAEDGGRIRATNGNSSYGVYGVIAEGYDDTEVPISGKIDNRSTQVQASVQSAFGASAELVAMNYANTGSGYFEQTTNMLKQSNDFFESPWTTDGNVTIQQNTTSPSGRTDGWTITGNTSSTNSSYVYQEVDILPPGYEYTNVSTVNVTGSGNSATFDITVGSTGYTAVVNQGGTGYVATNELRIPGSSLGGEDGTNDCFLTVTSLSGSSILNVSVTGTVPRNSDLNYTYSIYAKQGTADSFSISAIFSGDTSATTTVTYSFETGNFTTTVGANGATPVNIDKLELTNGWYRFWFTIYDNIALNDTLQFRIYPRSTSGLAGSTRFYGSQVQISSDPTFYLETTDELFASYADFNVSGAGTGAKLIGNEIRSKAVFQTRLTDTGTRVGGRGYLVASNNAQGGDASSIILSGSDTNLASNYISMRLFIQSGTGAGQYGYISAYDDAITKVASILKESFAPLNVSETDNGTGLITLGTSTTESLYIDQPVQFIPTYYTTTVTTTGIDTIIVNSTVGGSTNQLDVESTEKLDVNMPVRFTGAVYGGLVADFTYYIKEIIDATHITISTEIYGPVWNLNSATGAMSMTFPGYNNLINGSTSNMEVNMPIQFTGTSIGGLSVGTTYYINEVVSLTSFTISSTLIETTVTATAAGTNYLTTSVPTSTLVPFNPIKFSGVVFGDIVANNVYYINKIVNSSTFTIVDDIIETRATESTTSSNLITVTSTAGFVVNNPIQFIGNTFGGLTNGTTYYILAINDETTFTVSSSPGGAATNLSSATGDVLVKTTPAAFVVSNGSGTMTGTTTNPKTSVSQGYGSMNGTYSTSLFGDIAGGTTYYVTSIDSPTTFTVSETVSGSPITLKTDVGSMNLAAVGWDHIEPGTPIIDVLDNSTVYYVEPRLSYTAPAFSQSAGTTNTLAVSSEWAALAYGNGMFIALPSSNAIAGKSVDGITWEELPLTRPAAWTGIAYGNQRWVGITSGGTMGDPGSVVIYSSNDGEGWRETYMPSSTTWSNIAYGNGVFVAIATGTSTSAYSTNYGKDWSSGSGLPNAAWTGLTYGNGKFVAVASGGTTAAYSTDGTSWTSVTLPSSEDWSSIAYGSGLYVAVASTAGKPAYSQDGITWQESAYEIDGVDIISYGQGVFVAVSSTAGQGYTTEDGFNWKSRTISDDGYGAMVFGWIGEDFDGGFVTVADRTLSSVISAGTTTKARAILTSGTISSISIWEPGSNYTTAPVLTITDPNVTLNATTSVRLSNGALGNPMFYNRGQDYNTNSTVVTINGGGYADTYQTGLTIIVKDLSALPAPGDNLVVSGNSQIYKVTNATVVFGTTAPNIQANIQVSPEMSVELSPDHLATLTIRTKYSQCRLTGHDFLNCGYGNAIQSNYPNLPVDTLLSPQDQAVEVNFGRVFYTSTDQDGNFKVGDLFGVEQATGIVTLSATQFGLSGLETLSLGGIAVGGASVIIRQFSTDETFIANSNQIIPTQRAIKAYLEGRLSQGGANTFTGQLTAGTVVVGGADKIRSTIPEGTTGAVVNMPTMVRFQGEFAGWDGDGMALSYFIKSWNRR